MLDELLLRNLGLIIVAAAAFALLARTIRMPAIVAYILAGLFLGPLTGLVQMGDALELVAEVGVVLLLFLVGLELSLDKIRDVGKVAVAAGIGQVIFTALGGFGVAWLLGFNVVESVFLATALTFSSTVVVVKLLDKKGDLNALYGRIAVGIFLVQDLVVIVVLTFLAGLGSPDALEPAAIARGLGLAFGGMTLLLAGVLLAARFALPRPFGWAARSPQTLFIWSLGWCFAVVLVAEVLDLSLEIGAFLAGIALAQLPYSKDLIRRVHPLMNFFIAVFFVSLGVQMQFQEAAAHLGSAIVLSLFVLIGNPFIFMWIIARMGYGERTSFETSVTVAQISEFSFIFAAMGVTTGLIGSDILSLTALVGIVTIGVSSYMILYSRPLYVIVRRAGLLRLFRARADTEEETGGERAGHVIVVGMNTMGRHLARRLHESGREVLAIDTDPGKLLGLPCDTMIGDVQYRSVLEEAGLARASMLISALQIEDTNLLLAHRCRDLGVPCGIHAFDHSVRRDLELLDVPYLISSKRAGIRRTRREMAGWEAP